MLKKKTSKLVYSLLIPIVMVFGGVHVNASSVNDLNKDVDSYVNERVLGHSDKKKEKEIAKKIDRLTDTEKSKLKNYDKFVAYNTSSKIKKRKYVLKSIRELDTKKGTSVQELASIKKINNELPFYLKPSFNIFLYTKFNSAIDDAISRYEKELEKTFSKKEDIDLNLKQVNKEKEMLPYVKFITSDSHEIKREKRLNQVYKNQDKIKEDKAKRKAEREAKEKAEKEAKEKADKEAKEKGEREAREKAEREAREKAEREAREAQEEADRQARLAQEEANRQARLAQERAIQDENRQSKVQRNEGNIVSGYCKDGTPAHGIPSARGRGNACYGHGGWVR